MAVFKEISGGIKVLFICYGGFEENAKNAEFTVYLAGFVLRGSKSYVQMAVFKEISGGIKVLFICYGGFEENAKNAEFTVYLALKEIVLLRVY